MTLGGEMLMICLVDTVRENGVPQMVRPYEDDADRNIAACGAEAHQKPETCHAQTSPGPYQNCKDIDEEGWHE